MGFERRRHPWNVTTHLGRNSVIRDPYPILWKGTNSAISNTSKQLSLYALYPFYEIVNALEKLHDYTCQFLNSHRAEMLTRWSKKSWIVPIESLLRSTTVGWNTAYTTGSRAARSRIAKHPKSRLQWLKSQNALSQNSIQHVTTLQHKIWRRFVTWYIRYDSWKQSPKMTSPDANEGIRTVLLN